MARAPAAIFKIPTKSPQPARGRASRGRKAAAAQPKVPSRVLGIETRAATRGDGYVIGQFLPSGNTQISMRHPHVLWQITHQGNENPRMAANSCQSGTPGVRSHLQTCPYHPALYVWGRLWRTL